MAQGSMEVAMRPAGGRSLLVLYGTETGSSQDIAEEIDRAARRLHFDTVLCTLDSISLNQLRQHQGLTIIVISTTGQGVVPKNAEKFFRSIRRTNLPPSCLRNVRFTIFGLGDSAYARFNAALVKVRKCLLNLGAHEFFRVGEADERHENGTDSIYLPWFLELKDYLTKEFPLPENLAPIPDDAPLTPQVTLHLCDEMARPDDVQSVQKTEAPSKSKDQLDDEWFAANASKSAALSHTDRPLSVEDQRDIEYAQGLRHKRRPEAGGDCGKQSAELYDVGNILKDDPSKYLLSNSKRAYTQEPADRILPIRNNFLAAVTMNDRLTPASHWQDVRHIELDIEVPGGSSLKMEPGKTILIHPKNFDDDVQTLIDMMGWQNVADRRLVFRTNLSNGGNRPFVKTPPGFLMIKNSTLRDLLVHNFDITAVPHRSFLTKLSQYTNDEREKERLAELTDPKNSTEFYDYTSRPRRTILEILRDFEGVKIPLEHVYDVFPQIRPREFSIANGGPDLQPKSSSTKRSNDDGRSSDNVRSSDSDVPDDSFIRVELVVALVEYKTIIRKPREGLCSRYLKHLEPGSVISVGIGHGKPPPSDILNNKRPLLAIATGTGIAPIRSMILERYASGEILEEEIGPVLLFFGCRNKDADYYFAEEWPSLENLTVYPAFSRDPQEDNQRPEPPQSQQPPFRTSNPLVGGTNGEKQFAEDLKFTYDYGKNYVQHLIRKHAKEVCEFLRNDPIIYLCGNNGRMPMSVRAAITDAMVLGGLVETNQEAIERATKLFNNPRTFFQETW